MGLKILSRERIEELSQKRTGFPIALEDYLRDQARLTAKQIVEWVDRSMHPPIYWGFKSSQETWHALKKLAKGE